MASPADGLQAMVQTWHSVSPLSCSTLLCSEKTPCKIEVQLAITNQDKHSLFWAQYKFSKRLCPSLRVLPGSWVLSRIRRADWTLTIPSVDGSRRDGRISSSGGVSSDSRSSSSLIVGSEDYLQQAVTHSRPTYIVDISSSNISSYSSWWI